MAYAALESMDEKHVSALGEANIAALMLRYSLPAIAATVVSATYNVVDRIFVGRACGEDALAAVTVCFSPSLFFLAIAMTIGQGSATMVSIRLGEGNREAAERILGQAVFLFAAFYVFAASLALPLMRPMLMFFGATDKIVGLAESYYSIIIGGLIFEKLSFGINNLVRAEGRPVFAMATIVLGGALNAFFDWLFLMKFGFGVEGAAWATILAQACAAIWVTSFYFSGRNWLRLRLKNLRPRFDCFKAVISAGSPSFAIQFLASFAAMMYVRQARFYGSESAIVIIGVATTAATFMIFPVLGVSMGMQPIFGYNWGAKNYARVKGAFNKAVAFATVICTLGTLVLEIFAEEVYRIFLGGDSAIISDGAGALRILVACVPLIGVNIVSSGYFQSTKRPALAIFITTIRQLFVLVPMFYILPKIFGLTGVWLSYTVSDFLSFCFTLLLLRREMRFLSDPSISRAS